MRPAEDLSPALLTNPVFGRGLENGRQNSRNKIEPQQKCVSSVVPIRLLPVRRLSCSGRHRRFTLMAHRLINAQPRNMQKPHSSANRIYVNRGRRTRGWPRKHRIFRTAACDRKSQRAILHRLRRYAVLRPAQLPNLNGHPRQTPDYLRANQRGSLR